MGVSNAKASAARMGRLQSSIPTDFTIYFDGSVYRAESCKVGVDDISGANKTTVQQAAVNALASGGIIVLKGITLSATVTYGNSIMIVEDYQGRRKTYSNLGQSLLPQLVTDPSTVGWGATEEGRLWYNSTANKIKLWDGSSLQVIPSVGGGGTTYEMPYAYTVWQEGGTIYAQNGHTGVIDYSDPDVSVVLQDITDILTSSYGDILIKNGAYLPLTQVHVKDHVGYVGETFGGVTFTLPNALNDALFDGSHAFAWNVHDVRFKNLVGLGNGANQAALSVAPFIDLYVTSEGARGYNTILENIKVEDCAETCVYIESPSYPVVISHLWCNGINGARNLQGLRMNSSDSWVYDYRSGGQLCIGARLSGSSIKLISPYFGGATTTAYNGVNYGWGLYALGLRGEIQGGTFDHNYRYAIYTNDTANSYASATRFLTLTSIKFSNNSQSALTPNTWDVIRLDGHTHDVSLHNCQFYSDEANLPKYLVDEFGADCDYNSLGLGGLYSCWYAATGAKTFVRGAHTNDVVHAVEHQAYLPVD